MHRRSTRSLLTVFLILAMATLASFGTFRPAAAAGPITVDPAFLYLNLEPGGTAEATVNVTAGPDDFLFPSVNASWITLEETKTSSGLTIHLTATAAGMKSGEIRVARIYLSSYPAQVAVPVVLAVGGPSTPPPAVVYPAAVDFGTLSVGQSATSYLNLALSAPADITITADAPWIDAAPIGINGVTTALISVRPRLKQVAVPQTYTGNIVVQAGSLDPVRIPVTLTVASPDSVKPEPAAPAVASPFGDVPASHWASGAVAELASSGVINGVGGGNFAPDATVTREQFAKMLVLALGLSPAPQPAKAPYPDVAADRWSAPYIVMAQMFMARYTDGLFHPELPAIREEIAVALARAKGLKPADKPDLYIWFTDYKGIHPSAQAYIATARSVGLIDGFPDRTFRPEAPVTRAQMASMLQRARAICGNPPQAGCAAPLGPEDRTLAGATLARPVDPVVALLGPAVEERPGYSNSYTSTYKNGHVSVSYVTPSNQVWSVLLQGEGATPRGIKIGDTVEAVRKAYGVQAELKDGALTYRAGSEYDFFYIQFFIVDGKVQSISLTQSK